ncbi:30S ribosomal protein S17 [bacterium]|jgi:small subunit ribosomal protein S17|nr:30S ribosomal protein S17 [bacterium]MBT3903747.1 30S ribosomal protein S17 [bacterium]MBT4577950.1 30S ribosomal protein S17 [bacterium]MBT5346106.1 30S ribosomal protein S17 [bacterium]MBT6131375.1 30S ribosomal protein S17 [bacterium]
MADEQMKRTFRGVVVSDSMDKTVVVQVERVFAHPRVGKVVRTFKKYKVHDQDDLAKVGDTVNFYQGRPQSKTKYMYLLDVVQTQTAKVAS